MTQTPTIADYPAHLQLANIIAEHSNAIEGNHVELAIQDDKLFALNDEFQSLLEANGRLEEALAEAVKRLKQTHMDDTSDLEQISICKHPYYYYASQGIDKPMIEKCVKCGANGKELTKPNQNEGEI